MKDAGRKEYGQFKVNRIDLNRSFMAADSFSIQLIQGLIGAQDEKY